MPTLLAYDIGHVSSICVLANDSIISASDDKTLRVWSNPYAASRIFRKDENWRGLCALPDGGIAVGNNKDVWVYSDPDPMRGGRPRAAAVRQRSPETRARHIAIDQRKYMEQQREANRKRTSDAQAAARAALAPTRVLKGHTANVTSLCVLSDGRIISGSDDATLIVWTSHAHWLGSSLKILRGHTDAVTSVCAVPGDNVASGSIDTTVRLWSADTGVCMRVFTGHTGPVRSVCILTDQSIVSGSDDQTVRVWDKNTSTTLDVFKGHTGGVTCVAAQPDNMFVSGSDDGTLMLWDFYNATCVKIIGGGRERFLCLSVLVNGRIVSGSDHGLKIWETDEGMPCANFFAERARRAEAARDEAARRHIANVVARVAAARARVAQSVIPVRQAAPNLSISQALHIGTRVEGQGVFASGEVNAVNQEEFNDGDELVRIPAPGGIKMPPDVGGYHLFHANDKGGGTLQQWFDRGNRKDPLNNQVIQQNQLERFTYRKPAPAGGKRQSTKNKKSNRRRTVRR